MLRRNGKPRSCEPCRISKIRCDHTTPTCQKCQARGIADRCFYHPAPMTKPPGTPRRRTVKPKCSETLETRDHGVLTPLHRSPTTTLQMDEVSTAASSHPASMWPTPSESVTRTIPNPPESTRSFYLGSTSYASVFAEEHPIPESVHEQPSERLSATPSALTNGIPGSRYCQMGVAQSIIPKLSPFSLFERSIRMYFINNGPALVGPLIVSALPQLRKDLEQLSVTRNDSFAAYAEITRNTARPFKVPASMSPSEFHTLYTGQNLRWETLGLIFIVAGSNAQFTSPDHPVFTLESGRKINKDEFIEDMIQASNDCINLCQVHGAVNDIMVWLMYQNMLVTSNFYGDNYHGVWRRIADCVSSLYAQGIHCEENYEIPFFLRESRRRMYAATYKSDKTLATFFGRPPMMAWRYSDRKLPLDLDDDIIATDDTELLNNALSRLDSDGWNTEGKIWASSWIRLRFQLSMFRERVLELSLSGRTDGDVAQKLQSISTECRQAWEVVPAQLRYDLYGEDVVWSTLSSEKALRMISVYLDHLHTDFQMQRILRRQTEMAIPALLEISMKLLSTVLVFNKQRNQSYHTRRHFPSIILMYCLPSAGVLALELRRCTLENVPLPSCISRADLIRNLSVLISCLEWVILPGDGNHKLCSELNKMHAMVLDEVLNYQPPTNNESQGNGDGTALGTVGGGFFDMPMIDGIEPIPTESEDFLNWLDNANWNNTVCFLVSTKIRAFSSLICRSLTWGQYLF
ncbi:uncharacterized protein BDR25DRAFT_109618 [Lindgomyces ingoldianus]|uniref:Uncharacterized protein n=1 Tax=Lindgomyces ingoldianus TaxID=673940 RepID=A0ACB6R5U1_9PLEO|nr:uncharacterized protein BDR25DRAFT_109618 [Lindgomyces ingoldianus]KAF2474541.1 hypothetical protein BDR25DRAFT_109618 [Lindgomyces ingoldianus]